MLPLTIKQFRAGSFRGPKIYTKGDYHYHCKVDGEFVWFQEYEEIFYMDEKIYECYFHGGTIR